MEAKTQTIIGELQIGDRFYFVTDKQRIVYQVTGCKFISIRHYNIVAVNGIRLWAFDKDAKEEREVVFLRHTVV